jgi:hypothetical protein
MCVIHGAELYRRSIHAVVTDFDSEPINVRRELALCKADACASLVVQRKATPPLTANQRAADVDLCRSLAYLWESSSPFLVGGKGSDGLSPITSDGRRADV